ncbi:ankyrin repeat domain-containing protein 24 isoform X2 [Aplysia californica]|uniref:Ankyrin repeat domain-containing protein 24 isoform X2 n=1 Tax=Aplysia californica TaxID=6500 RepID=A0ABM0K949_APLCA|nr:ankyrin repeat domain-containing protein 24 isoform X2 [Aplysia californica]
MSKLKVRNLFRSKFPRTKSTSELAEWTKSDEKLMKAVENGDVKKVTSLLAKKSLVPTKLGPLGRSVFHIACALGNDRIVDLLLKSTEDVNDLTIQGNSPLQLSAAKGHSAVVDRLLKASADVDLRDSNDMTALHHACAGQHLEVVNVLLQGHASPHLTEKGGKTPLFYSAHRGRDEICKLLLDKGAEINCQDILSVTPLMIAAKEGHRRVCEFLLRRGANADLKDREGHSALNYAIAAGHGELHEVFDRPPVRVFVDDPPSPASVQNHPESHLQSDFGLRISVEPHAAYDDGVDHQINETPVEDYVTDDESVSHIDAQSVHSVDDRLLSREHTSSASALLQTGAAADKTERALRELKEEHDQLNDDYSTLSVENLRLRDRVQSLLGRLNDKDQQINNLKLLLEEEKEKVRALQEQDQTKVKQIAADDQNPNLDKMDKEDSGNTSLGTEEDVTLVKLTGGSGLNDGETIGMLRSQLLALKNENEQLKTAVSLPNGDIGSDKDVESEPSEEGKTAQLQQIKTMQFEIKQLHSHINERKDELEKHLLSSAVDQEELLQQNASMTSEVKGLKQQVALLEEALEAAKTEGPTEAQRLDALLEQSRNFFEEVSFDDDGFVNGRDMTKEEFLQSQNQQLKAHCSLLTDELEKLRATFDAILKAGDNLQADYDQQAAEKDQLQDELDLAVKEKTEVIKANEFLLTDNNALHDDLNKLVHELEKMQEKFTAAQAENEELKRSVGVASKVGEVARLLEERDKLQQKCEDYDSTVIRLQHDHGILLEEVQSLSESVTQLTAERDQLTADLEVMESVCQQNEALQQDYGQLELDFGELLKEKESLEQLVAGQEGGVTAAEKLQSVQSVAPSDETASLQVAYEQVAAEKDEVEASLEQLRLDNASLQDQVKKLESNQVDLLAANGNNNVGEEKESDSSEELSKSREELITLKKQVARLTKDVSEWEKRHSDTVTTYRTHLLSAVQGHMDPDVKDALYHIIELRSMEQFC